MKNTWWRKISICWILGSLTLAPAYSAELVLNGSFERLLHDAPEAWSIMSPGNDASVWGLDKGRQDASALKMVWSGEPDLEPVEVFQRGIAFKAGQDYTLSLYVRGTGTERLLVRIGDLGRQGPSYWIESIIADKEWKEYRFQFTLGETVPVGNLLLGFVLDSPGTLWIDDVSLLGDSGNGGAQQLRPVFQPRVQPLSSKNLIPNGSFECGSDGWFSLGQPLCGGNVAGLYGDIDSSSASSGRRSYRLSHGPGITPESHAGCWPPQSIVQRRLLVANRGWIDVEAGQTYILSADMRSDRPGTIGVLQLNYSGDAREGVRTMTKEVSLTADWRRYHFEAVVPEGNVYVAIGADVTGDPDSNITFWADAIQLEQSKSPTPFEPREDVELGFSTGRYGNVFPADQPILIEVNGSNVKDVAVPVDVEFRLTDYWGRLLPKDNLSFVLPAGRGETRSILLDLAPGFYRAQFSWKVAGRRDSRTLRLAVINPFQYENSPFGLNHEPTTGEALDLFRQAGVTWVRTWAVDWQAAEPQRGKISFEGIDPILGRLKDRKMNVLALLPPQPSTDWATEAPDTVSVVHDRRSRRNAYAPRVPEDLFDFISTAAGHYKGTVPYWEFLNEPLWVQTYSLPGRGGYTTEDYITLLKGAAAAIRRTDSSARIVGGLSIQAEMRLGDEFIKAGGLNYIDVYNLHPYAARRLPESIIPNMERVLKAMDDHGERKPIWATETGYYGADEYPYLPWDPPQGDFAATRLLENEQQSADYIVRFSVILLAHGVEKIFWHWPRTGDANNAIRDLNNPFIAHGGEPRKAYAAMSNLANVLGAEPRFVCRWPVARNGSSGGVYGYAFSCGEHAVLVAWATGDEAGRWELVRPRPASGRDIVGMPLPEERVVLSESAVFITSTSLSAVELAQLCLLEPSAPKGSPGSKRSEQSDSSR